ncbi:serine hydrolase [Paenibacillus rhizoplanae]
MFREWELPSSAMGKSSGKKGFGVLEKGKARPVKVNTVFHACSISKMFTAAGGSETGAGGQAGTGG